MQGDPVVTALGYLLVLGGGAFAVLFPPLMGLIYRTAYNRWSHARGVWLLIAISVEGMGVGGMLIGFALLHGKLDIADEVLTGLGFVCILLSLITMVIAARLEPRRRP